MTPPKSNPTIGIIGGRGTLGQIFRKAFENAGYKVIISGRKPDGKKVLSNKTLARKADVIIVSVFLKDTIKVIREITPLLKSSQLLTDLTSLKSEPVSEMLKSKAEVVGLHPMFGKVDNLEGNNIFACPVRSKKWWPWLKTTLENFGLIIHKTSPKKHDELAAIHQAASHLLSISFARLLEKNKIEAEDLFKISSPSTKLKLLISGRLLNCDPELYSDIQFKNPLVKKSLKQLKEINDELVAAVNFSERTKFLKSFKSASKHFGDWKKWAFETSNKIFQNIKSGELETKKTEKVKKKKISPRKSIAVFGTGTQTEMAAIEFIKKNKAILTPVGYRTITEIFNAVLNDKCLLGFTPLENYTIGPVRETMKKLFETKGKVKIINEFSRPIAHALAGNKKSNKKAERIFGHPQALAQSRKFLQKNFPKAELIEVHNAGEAIAACQKDLLSLAVCPAEAATKLGLKIFHKNIEDDPNNRTRFVIIGKKPLGKLVAKKPKRTALAFYFKENKAGQLASALSIFAKEKINLSRIESIPTEKKLGEFFFFTECEATEKNKSFTKALRELSKIATVVNLGSY